MVVIHGPVRPQRNVAHSKSRYCHGLTVPSLQNSLAQLGLEGLTDGCFSAATFIKLARYAPDVTFAKDDFHSGI